MVDEIVELGFRRIECGYRLGAEQLEGVRRRLREGVIGVSSLHAYCPNSAGSLHAGPEFVTPAHASEWTRNEALSRLELTLATAVDLDAKAVVVHAGRVDMRPGTPGLIRLARRDRQNTYRYLRRLERFQTRRERCAPPHREALYRSLDYLLPVFEAAGVALCIEILPEWEALPTEAEWLEIHRRYPTPALRYWHDFGHANIRERLGFGYQRAWLERILPLCAGLHLHTNDGLSDSHDLPPQGGIRFSDFSFLSDSGMIKVLEPAPETPAENIRAAVAFMQCAWTKT